MKVRLKLVRRLTARTCYIKEVEHEGIAFVYYHSDWVILVPLDPKIQQISYRKDLVFAVVEEKEEGDE